MAIKTNNLKPIELKRKKVQEKYCTQNELNKTNDMKNGQRIVHGEFLDRRDYR